MKAVNFQDDIPSIANDNFEHHHVLVFYLTAMQDATGSCHYPKLVGEPLRLDLISTFPREYATELIVWGNECLRLQLTKMVLLEKISIG